MGDKETLKGQYPSNSKSQKRTAVVTNKNEVKKVKKVISGRVKQQKKTLSRRFMETFIEDDTKSVGSYIYYDVIIPAAKSMICDLVGWGGFAEMMLFGEKRGHRTRREGGRSHVSYGSYYRSQDRDRDRDRDRREISRMSRARHDFDEIVLETRGEAENVLSHLVDLICDYDQATVADFYDLVGIEQTHVDSGHGWVDLHGANVIRARRGGYIINLPRTRPLD